LKRNKLYIDEEQVYSAFLKDAEVAKWTTAAALRAVVARATQGFKSLPQRSIKKFVFSIRAELKKS
jgi:hypothetical protein